MHWNRRQPTWPYVVALGCLFALTLAAPSWWQRLRREKLAPRVATNAAQTDSTPTSPEALPARPMATAYSTASIETVPPLPPLALHEAIEIEPSDATAPLVASEPSDSVVESDDYVVVDEPLPEPVAANEAVAPEQPAAVPELLLIAADEGREGRSAGRSVLVRNVAAPTWSMRPPVTRESLVRVRDAILAMLDEVKERQRQLTTPVRQHRPHRIVVTSELDRLAMVPDLAEAEDAAGPTPVVDVAPAPMPALAPAAPPRVAANFAVRPAPPPAPPALVHRPDALIAQLRALEPGSAAGSWAAAALARLDRLTTEPASSIRAQTLLAELRRLAIRAYSEAPEAGDASLQTAWLRAGRALDRRLPVWQLLLDKDLHDELAYREVQLPSDDIVVAAIDNAAAATAGSVEGESWRSYLRLNDLASLTSAAGQDFVEARRAIARDVLWRMSDPQLSRAQTEFLAQPALVELAASLLPWASGPVSLDALAALIERYESTGARREGDAIAEMRLRLKWSNDERLEALAEDLDRNYRNANLRVALSSDLFNRLIPVQEPVVAPVRENIVGATVRGRSRTQTQVRVRLLPDAAVWRFGLEVDGVVQSQTHTDVGPARVRNSSRIDYEARKLILVNRYGLHVWPAEANVDGRSSLVGVESHFDPVPLVGSIVEDVVRQEHRDNQAAALRHVKAKVGREARERMDREADAKLAELRQRFDAGVFEPLQRFSLAMQFLEMSTSDKRAVMRARMADEQQLGAHTPRPSAPSDSVASLQIHESTVNNALRGLGLDGRRMTIGELHALLQAKFARHSAAPPADLPQRAIVHFADHDAVRISWHDDCMELTLNIVELRRGRDNIRHVGVHAFFRPVVEGLEVRMVRDGGLQFEGAHLRTGTRMVLHSVFGKLLRKDQEVPVLARDMDDDVRYAGLMVTQLVIDDGWAALSLGPALPMRTAWRTRTAVTR